jgi:DNA-binding NarL/FixJ family response regulator
MEVKPNKKNAGLKIGIIMRPDYSRLLQMLKIVDGIASVQVVKDIKSCINLNVEAASFDTLLLGADIFSTKESRNIQKLRASKPGVSIIVILDSINRDAILQVIAAGVEACICLEEKNVIEVIAAIVGVKNGGCYLSPAVIRELFMHIAGEMPGKDWNRLTFIERRIVAAIAEEALPQKLVAQKMNTSPNTIRHHLKNIYRKLNIHSAGELSKRFFMKKYGPLKNDNI